MAGKSSLLSVRDFKWAYSQRFGIDQCHHRNSGARVVLAVRRNRQRSFMGRYWTSDEDAETEEVVEAEDDR